MIKNSGIYKIQSRIKPERIYIGSTIDFDLRKSQHLYDLRNVPWNKNITYKIIKAHDRINSRIKQCS
jgi:hypothetical protein